jgi:hypothetical protein
MSRRARTLVPSPAELAAHLDRQVQRVERALQSLEVGDVLAQLDQLIAQEPDPSKHPCHDLVAYLLDRAWTPGDGGQFWDQWKALACQAIDQLVDEALSRGDD